MKQCPYCGKEYPDEIERCLLDDEVLVGGPPVPPILPAPVVFVSPPAVSSAVPERQMRIIEVALVCLVAVAPSLVSSTHAWLYPAHARSYGSSLAWGVQGLREVAALASPGLSVLMSSDAWTDYEVPGSPFFVLVDGITSWPPMSNPLAALAPSGGEAGVNAMADAAEVLSSMYECFLRVSSAFRRADQLSPIHAQFGLDVAEQVWCERCRLATHQIRYTTFFHIVHSTALRHAAQQRPGETLEARLAGIMGEDCKGCDSDLRGCGTRTPIQHTLERQPTVFTISLAWETSQADEEEVAATLRVRAASVGVGCVVCCWLLVCACADAHARHGHATGAEPGAGSGHGVQQRAPDAA